MILVVIVSVTSGILGFTYYQRRKLRLAEDERLQRQEEFVLSFHNPIGRAQRSPHNVEAVQGASPTDRSCTQIAGFDDTAESLRNERVQVEEDAAASADGGEVASFTVDMSIHDKAPGELDLADLPKGYMFVSRPPQPDVDLPEPTKPKSNAAPAPVFGFPLLASEFDARHAATVDPLFPAPPTDVTEILSMRGNRMTIPSYGAAASAGSCVMPRPCDTNDE